MFLCYIIEGMHTVRLMFKDAIRVSEVVLVRE